jgi:hypothetical protein
MAKSTGIILAAGAITTGNEWIHNKFNWKVPIATLGAAAIFAGLEQVSEPAAVGIAVIALITVLVGGITPGVPSPIAQIVSFMQPPKGK